jgi:hypothetical protein
MDEPDSRDQPLEIFAAETQKQFLVLFLKSLLAKLPNLRNTKFSEDKFPKALEKNPNSYTLRHDR